MEITDAIQLISGRPVRSHVPETWADLGCGSGTFTMALGAILPEGSTVYAIDRIKPSIDPGPVPKVEIVSLTIDFVRKDLPVPSLDGILMANSLHYVKDKPAMLGKLKGYFKDRQKYIIVEYDTLKANPWIPYPIDFMHLKTLFQAAGCEYITLLGKKPSRYRQEHLYACLIEEMTSFKKMSSLDNRQ